jgi:hypothetical protein
VTTSVSTRFELPRLQERQVIHIVDMKVDFDIQGMAVHFDNLFNGNKVLGECPPRGNATNAPEANTEHTYMASRHKTRCALKRISGSQNHLNQCLSNCGPCTTGGPQVVSEEKH